MEKYTNSEGTSSIKSNHFYTLKHEHDFQIKYIKFHVLNIIFGTS